MIPLPGSWFEKEKGDGRWIFAQISHRIIFAQISRRNNFAQILRRSSLCEICE